MKMNRRNVLVGLGTIVAGGGAALGTGAFSSVEADRTVSVDIAGDSDAFLGISVNDDYAVDGSENGDGAVEIDLGDSDSSDGFNENAVTNINGVLTLTNNAADDGGIEVSFGDRDGSDNGGHKSETTIDVDNTAEVTFSLADTEGADDDYKLLTNDDSDSNSVGVNVEVDTRVDSPGDEDLTIYAFDDSSA